MNKLKPVILIFLLLIFSEPVSAGGNAGYIQAIDMSLLWALPFSGLLACLALMPITAPSIWHSHYGKITLFWATLSIISIFYNLPTDQAMAEVSFVYIEHYLPFMILAGSLYVIAGGIYMDLKASGSTKENLSILAIGTFIASWIGTTGAAMILIRPLIHINRWRKYKSHTIIFFIILVCNIGGSLSPIGDPPLFLGFLFGVDFFWPTKHLFAPFVIVTIPLLAVYYLIDSKLMQRENIEARDEILEKIKTDSVKFKGKRNLALMFAVVGMVMLSGVWKSEYFIKLFGVKIELQDLVRDIALVFFAILSLTVTSQEPRRINNFTWEPITEVAKIFAGIFITAAPVMAILGKGENGALAVVTETVNHHGSPINYMYFWMTGFLSSFLDNAPTYMVFFQMAGGDAQYLMNEGANTLLAISVGSVFMGAITYIGNAPNFMVKSIAEANMIQMPSFFKYMTYALILLVPLFVLLTFLFFI